MDRAIHWFLCNKFNVDLVDSIQSRSLLGVPCHCSFTQPNTCIRSLAATAADITMDGLCQELPAYGPARAEGVSFES